MTKAEGGRRKAEGQSGRIRLKDALARTSLSPGASFPLPPSAVRLRSGVTLIELLLVVTIILIMMALAARQMQVAKDLRRNRETARAVSVYLGSARSTALANRRPCGVVLTLTPGIPQCVMTLQQAEVPAPYAGDSIAASATVTRSGGTYTATLSGATNLSTLVHQGDVVQFNYEGPWYAINGVSGQSLTVAFSQQDQTQGQIAPWPATTTQWTGPGVPFRIYRQPYNNSGAHTKAVASPLQLPAGAVIDVGSSGTDAANFSTSDSTGNSPIYIMFSPSGAIQSVYQNGTNFLGPVSTPIFLLVGKVGLARGFGVAPVQYNYQDVESLWVVISPQNGLVTVAPVGSTTNSTPQSLTDSRGMARNAQLLEGR